MNDDQPDLFTPRPPRAVAAAPSFDGETIERVDLVRLTGQMDHVFNIMKDGTWRTLFEIVSIIGTGSEAGVSARLRDLRKPKFGSHTVSRRRRGEPSGGLFEYQLVIHGR